MGNKSQKKTNQMLQNQTNLANQFGSTMGERSSGEYDFKKDLRDQLVGEYWNLYKGSGEEDSGGGGEAAPAGPTLESLVRMNEGMDTAREFMNTGGWTPEQIAQQKSWSTSPVAGLYEGLKRQMTLSGAGMGLPGSYSGAFSRLAADRAREMGEITNRATMDIENDIRDRRMSGVGMVGGFDTEYMDRLEKARAEDRAAQERARARRRAASAAANDERDSYLRALTGLMGSATDLPYAQLQLSGIQHGTDTVRSRVDETPTWQKMAGSLIPSAASAALGIFGGGGGGQRKDPREQYTSPDYYDPYFGE
jgi:hypothetical protein